MWLINTQTENSMLFNNTGSHLSSQQHFNLDCDVTIATKTDNVNEAPLNQKLTPFNFLGQKSLPSCVYLNKGYIYI